MKKTLAAVAVLGAFAGSALAADVQLYGIVDTGLQYVHGDTDSTAPNSDFDSFSMESGMASDRKSTRLNSSHNRESRMPSSA